MTYTAVTDKTNFGQKSHRRDENKASYFSAVYHQLPQQLYVYVYI